MGTLKLDAESNFDDSKKEETTSKADAESNVDNVNEEEIDPKADSECNADDFGAITPFTTEFRTSTPFENIDEPLDEVKREEPDLSEEIVNDTNEQLNRSCDLIVDLSVSSKEASWLNGSGDGAGEPNDEIFNESGERKCFFKFLEEIKKEETAGKQQVLASKTKKKPRKPKARKKLPVQRNRKNCKPK